MAQKKDLNEYLTTIGKIKPSAATVFKSANKDGTIVEESSTKNYVSKHATTEIDLASKVPGLADRLQKNLKEAANKAAQVDEEDLDDLAQEIEDEHLAENAEVQFIKPRDANAIKNSDSPMTHVPNGAADASQKTTAQMSETALLLQLVSKLIDKIDEMQNFNPVIHVPAPIIHVTLPETKRTVTKAVERDSDGWIKSVREHIEETPQGEPLIEVEQPKKKRKPKDSE